MKRPVLLSVLLLAGTASAFAEYPFEGSWAYDCTVSGGDVVPTAIEPGRIVYYESECTIDKVDDMGRGGQVWTLTTTCSGEGETWQRVMVLGLEPEGQGKPQRLVELDFDFGSVQVHERCE